MLSSNIRSGIIIITKKKCIINIKCYHDTLTLLINVLSFTLISLVFLYIYVYIVIIFIQFFIFYS